METQYDVAIVGAGLSGISAAEELIREGKSVLLIEKGRSVGGRLATRRIGEGKADHGAQFFTVRTQRLQEKVDQWLEKGWVKKWFGEDHPRYLASEGMNELAKKLSRGMEYRLNTKVTAIRETNAGWMLQPLGIEAKVVVLTAPAPQCAKLLKDSGLETLDGWKSLHEIKFHTCLVGLIEMNSSPNWNKAGFIKENLPDGVDRMVNHFVKGISKKPTITIYMTAQWSNQHFNEQDEAIIEHMMTKTENWLDRADVESVQLKRWRYSEAKNVYREPFLPIGHSDHLFVCGDAFLLQNDNGGSRFESAFLSGKALADRINEISKKE